MNGPAENPGVPKLRFEDYINKLETLDAHFDSQRNNGNLTMTEDFYGEFDSLDDQNDRFVHDMVSVRIAVKVYTKASMEDKEKAKGKFLLTPEDVDHYEMWISHLRSREKVYINTRDPDLAREIHQSFFEMLAQKETASEAINWLFKQSRYARMKSTIDQTFALVDSLPMSAHKKVRELDRGLDL